VRRALARQTTSSLSRSARANAPPQFDHSTQVQGCVREAGVSLGDGWIPHKS